MRKEHELPPYERKPYWEPEKVIAFYQDHDKPLSRETIEYHLANLIGTSFLRTAIEGITHKYTLGRNHRDYLYMQTLTHASSFFTALCGMDMITYFDGEIGDAEKRVQALIAMHTLLPADFSPDHVYGYQTLLPDEMMVTLRRGDDIFTDTTQATRAYTHLAQQVLFIKGGELIDGFGVSSIWHQPAGSEGERHSIMTGLHEVDYFTNPASKPLAFIAPETHRFDGNPNNSYTALFIGLGFDEKQASYGMH